MSNSHSGENLQEKRDRLKAARLVSRANKSPLNVEKKDMDSPFIEIEKPITNTYLIGVTKEISAQPGMTGLTRSFLCSGNVITFVSTFIEFDRLESETYVNEVTNGRKQELLTEINLKALTLGIEKRGQLSPAYGFKHNDGRIEIIDGSRRLKAVQKAKEQFWVMVCDLTYLDFEVITEDKIEIRNDLQTAKEQSIYDLGHECLALEVELGSAAKVAEYLKISPSHVSRVKKIAAIPIEIIGLFDDYNVLRRADFEKLGKLVSQSLELNVSIDVLGVHILDTIDVANSRGANDDFDPVIQAEKIIAVITKKIKDYKLINKPKSDNVRNHNYSKDKSITYRATRRTERKGGHVTEVFSLKDAPRELCDKLDKLISRYVDDASDNSVDKD